MSKQKMEDTSQPGEPKTSQYSKYDKKVEKFIGPIVSEETAILASAQVLMAAFDTALQKHDESSMIDIADRWIAISQILGQKDEDDSDRIEFKAPIGFIKEKEEDFVNESESPDYECKGITKVRS